MSLVTLTIDNRIVAVAPGATILEAAKKLGIKRPFAPGRKSGTLRAHAGFHPFFLQKIL